MSHSQAPDPEKAAALAAMPPMAGGEGTAKEASSNGSAQKLLEWLDAENEKLTAKVAAGKEKGVPAGATDLPTVQGELESLNTLAEEAKPSKQARPKQDVASIPYLPPLPSPPHPFLPHHIPPQPTPSHLISSHLISSISSHLITSHHITSCPIPHTTPLSAHSIG